MYPPEEDRSFAPLARRFATSSLLLTVKLSVLMREPEEAVSVVPVTFTERAFNVPVNVAVVFSRSREEIDPVEASTVKPSYARPLFDVAALNVVLPCPT